MKAKVEDKSPIVDSEILEFIRNISEPVRTWESFYFPLKEKGYVYFNVQTLQNYHFQFLDRIIFTDHGIKKRGTIIGEHEGTLYINLDTHFYAQAVLLDGNEKLPIEVDTSGKTDFQSISEFQHKYLGFYLTTHNQYLRDSESKKGAGFRNNFWAKMERNEAYIKNTQLIEKTLDRVKSYNGFS
ncbi:hypothetical protein [Legionella sp. WA2022007384]